MREVKYIAILPSFITLLNGICGFIAIIYADQLRTVELVFLRRLGVSSLAMAGFMIFIAMIADMVDGWLARLVHSASDFGAQLDSLSDTISFGVAPAFLMLKLETNSLRGLMRNESAVPILDKVIVLIAFIYLSCAVIRLARFNVESAVRDKTTHGAFTGIPSPAAAGVVAGFIVFDQSFLPKVLSRFPRFYHVCDAFIVAALPLITLGMAFLMVSRIRYPHVASEIMRSKKSLPSFVLVFLVLLFAILNIQIALLAGFLSYTLFGIVSMLAARLKREKNV